MGATAEADLKLVYLFCFTPFVFGINMGLWLQQGVVLEKMQARNALLAAQLANAKDLNSVEKETVKSMNDEVFFFEYYVYFLREILFVWPKLIAAKASEEYSTKEALAAREEAAKCQKQLTKSLAEIEKKERQLTERSKRLEEDSVQRGKELNQFREELSAEHVKRLEEVKLVEVQQQKWLLTREREIEDRMKSIAQRMQKKEQQVIMLQKSLAQVSKTRERAKQHSSKDFNIKFRKAEKEVVSFFWCFSH